MSQSEDEHQRYEPEYPGIGEERPYDPENPTEEEGAEQEDERTENPARNEEPETVQVAANQLDTIEEETEDERTLQIVEEEDDPVPGLLSREDDSSDEEGEDGINPVGEDEDEEEDGEEEDEDGNIGDYDTADDDANDDKDEGLEWDYDPMAEYIDDETDSMVENERRKERKRKEERLERLPLPAKGPARNSPPEAESKYWHAQMRQHMEPLEKFYPGISDAYRCRRCLRLHYSHEGRNVKGCNKGAKPHNEVIKEMISQYRDVRSLYWRLKRAEVYESTVDGLKAKVEDLEEEVWRLKQNLQGQEDEIDKLIDKMFEPMVKGRFEQRKAFIQFVQMVRDFFGAKVPGGRIQGQLEVLSQAFAREKQLLDQWLGTELEYIHLEDIKEEMKRIQRTEPDPTKGRRTKKGGENFNRSPCPSCQENLRTEKGEPSPKMAEKRTNEEDAAETEVKTRVAPEVGATKTPNAPVKSKYSLVSDGAMPFIADKNTNQNRPRTPKTREDDSVSLTVESDEERDLIRPEENQDDMADQMFNIESGTQEREKVKQKSSDKDQERKRRDDDERRRRDDNERKRRDDDERKRRDDEDRKRRDDEDRKRRDAEERKRLDDNDRRHREAEDQRRKEDDEKRRRDNDGRKRDDQKKEEEDRLKALRKREEEVAQRERLVAEREGRENARKSTRTSDPPPAPPTPPAPQPIWPRINPRGDDEEDDDKKKKDKKKDAAQGPTPPVPVYPGLKDPPVGQPLKHRVAEGGLCGGTCDPKKQLEAQKLLKSRFHEDDDCFKWLVSKRRLLLDLANMYPNEEIYVFLGFFAALAVTHERYFRPLFEKEAFFTSFEHFLREFEKVAYSNMVNLVAGRLRSMKQADYPDLGVRQFYNRYIDYIKVLNVDPEKYKTEFRMALKDERIRVALRQQQETSKDPLTLQEVADHAVRVEGEIQAETALTKRITENTRRIHSVAVEKKKSPTPRYRRASVSGSSSSDIKKWGPPNKSSRYSPSGSGSRWTKFQRGSSAEKARPSQAKSASPHKDHVMFDKLDKTSWRKGIARLMQDKGVSGCQGCLNRSHVFNYSFKGCRRNCPFCNKSFQDRDAHVAIKCPRLPAGKEIFSALAKAK